MDSWNEFFMGELGAAAALAGLLFVSISVNQKRILELGRMADRGLEGLAMLFMVLVVASLPLIPNQPPRLLGGEIFGIGAATAVTMAVLQIAYLRHLEPDYRRRAMTTVWVNRLAVGVIALAGLAMVWRGDAAGLYGLAGGILLTFLAVGANAWVLLIEINR